MAKKLSILLFVLTLIPALLIAQTKVVLRADGQISKSGVFTDGNEIQSIQLNKKAERQYFSDFNNITDLDKVLFYTFPDVNVNFGFMGQDWMVQWFVAPADMYINRAGFNVNAVDDDHDKVSLKLVKLSWTKDQITNIGVKNLGYYPADENTDFNSVTAFLDNPDRTGDWVEVNGLGSSPFGEDIWSDGGLGAPMEPVPSGAINTYQWVEMSLLGSTVEVAGGDIIGVAMHNDGKTMDKNRVGMLANNTLGITGFKFYTNGRNTPGGIGVGDLGWWSRAYTWDFALDVTIFGDPPPDISDVTNLPTTLSTEDRTVKATVEDTNPGGGDAGVASAELMYSIDGGTNWTSIAMSAPPIGSIYTGTLPGQEAGTHVDYYVKATDVAGNVSESQHFGYEIFKPTYPNLLVFNGWSTPDGYPQSYYFGRDDFATYKVVGWDHDIWCYGPLTEELLSNYSNVIYIATRVSTIDPTENDVIRAWLASKTSNNFALFGDEWLGAQSNWTDLTYSEGDFQFDILGIAADYNDISYDGTSPIDGSVVHPQEGTLLGGPLFDKYNQVSTDNDWTAPMIYSPAYEISTSNWLDGVDFTDDVEVDMTGENFDGSATYSILGHRTLSAGNKVVFGSYDPISLDSDTENEVEYYWYGFSYSAPQVTMLSWFDIPTGVRETNDATPVEFKLSQNYPNPFNPSTIIKFAIPQSEFVTMKVYDVLGKEVSTIINKNLTSGSYEVNFDASGLAAGMYIYQIKAGNFVSAKKMMLLK